MTSTLTPLTESTKFYEGGFIDFKREGYGLIFENSHNYIADYKWLSMIKIEK